MKYLALLCLLCLPKSYQAPMYFATFEEAHKPYILTNDKFAAWEIVANPSKKINLSNSCVMMDREKGVGVLGVPEHHYHAKVAYKELKNIGDINTVSMFVYGKKGARLNIEWFDDHSLLEKVGSAWAGDDQLLKQDNTWQLDTIDVSKMAYQTIRSIRISIGSYESEEVDMKYFNGKYYFDDIRFFKR